MAGEAHRIAKGLREFGYPDVTPAMVTEVITAIRNGDADLPHGVVGTMIQSLYLQAKGAS